MNRRAFVQTLAVPAVVGAGLTRVATTTAAAPVAGSLQASGSGQASAEPIRIGGNENPYGPAPSAVEAVRTAAMQGNRYPGPTVQALASAIAARHGVPADRVMLSGGSGDVLRACVTAFTTPTEALVTGLPSYESPVRTATAIGSGVREIPLDDALRLDLRAMGAASVGAGLLYICNPNNPTATALPAEAIAETVEKVLAASPSTHVLVDEAYFEYADLPGFASAVPLVAKYPQVVIARTFSKIFGMAGMRVGYAIAQPATLAMLRAHHSSSGMSVMSLTAATASLADAAHLDRQVALNRDVRRMTVKAFEDAGYRVAVSDANFVFAEIRRDSRGFQDACRQKGVMVGRAFPPLTTWARISIGTREEMERAIPVFMEVLAATPTPTASIDRRALDELPNELT